MADRVAVMYAGRIVEQAPVRDDVPRPAASLHARAAGVDSRRRAAARGCSAIEGTVPPLGALPPGCAFAPRCPHRFEPCDKAVPGMTLIGDLVPRGFRFERADDAARRAVLAGIEASKHRV